MKSRNRTRFRFYLAIRCYRVLWLTSREREREREREIHSKIHVSTRSSASPRQIRRRRFARIVHAERHVENIASRCTAHRNVQPRFRRFDSRPPETLFGNAFAEQRSASGLVQRLDAVSTSRIAAAARPPDGSARARFSGFLTEGTRPALARRLGRNSFA